MSALLVPRTPFLAAFAASLLLVTSFTAHAQSDGGSADAGPDDAGTPADAGTDAGTLPNSDAGTAASPYLSLVVPSSLPLNICTQGKVEIRSDVDGALLPAAQDTWVTLSATGVVVYSNSGCDTPTTSTTVNAGEASATFYLKAVAGSSWWLYAASAYGSTSGGGSISGTQLLLTSNTGSDVQAGQCVPLSIRVQTTTGGTRVVTNDTRVSLFTDSTGSYYGNDTCGTAVGSVIVPAGSADAQVWYKPKGAGLQELVARADEIADGHLALSVYPGPPEHLRLTFSPPSVTVGQQAGLTVNAIDAYGNEVYLDSSVTLVLGDQCTASPGEVITAIEGTAQATVMCQFATRLHVWASANDGALTGESSVAFVPPDGALSITLSLTSFGFDPAPGMQVSGYATVVNNSTTEARSLGMAFLLQGLDLQPSHDGGTLIAQDGVYPLPRFAPNEFREFPVSGMVVGMPGTEGSVVAQVLAPDGTVAASSGETFAIEELSTDVGCGCGAASAGLLPGAVLALLLARRRSRRR